MTSGPPPLHPISLSLCLSYPTAPYPILFSFSPLPLTTCSLSLLLSFRTHSAHAPSMTSHTPMVNDHETVLCPSLSRFLSLSLPLYISLSLSLSPGFLLFTSFLFLSEKSRNFFLPLPILCERSNSTRLGFFFSDCLCFCGACARGFGEGSEVRSRSNTTTLVPAGLHCVRDLEALSGKLFMPLCCFLLVSVMPCNGTRTSTPLFSDSVKCLLALSMMLALIA